MKVMELLTPNMLKDQPTDQPARSKWNELTRQKGTKQISKNSRYADAFSIDNDPGTINKVARPTNKDELGRETHLTSLGEDGYYQYLDMLSKNERISNNPFFPRIYDLKTFKGKDSKYTYSVNMEKLQPMDTLSLEEVLMLGRNLFTDFDASMKQYRAEIYPDLKTPKRTDSEAENERLQHWYQGSMRNAAVDCLAHMFDVAMDYNSGVATNVKNSHLKQAMMLIRKTVQSNQFVSDIHRDNIMVRRGPTAPQIVVTDPIS